MTESEKMGESYDRLKQQRRDIESKQATADEELLATALDVLEYVTFHDGRYAQEQRRDWQTKAQQLVARLAKRLNVQPYREYNKAKS